MRRFLFVLEFFPPHIGGVEVLFGELAEELARRGHAVEVITSAERSEVESRGNITIRRIRAGRYLFMLRAIPHVIRAARRVDLIHTTTYNAAIPAWIAAKLTRKPIVLTAHEVFGPQWQQMPGMSPILGYAYRLFEALVLRLGWAHVITPSDFTRNRLPDPSRATTIHNAVDHEFWSAARHEPRKYDAPFVYLYFGRPGVSKGVEYLLDAAEIVRRERPDSRLVMILSREPFAQYARMLPRIQALGDHVILLDSVPREELPGYLLGANCVVVPSLSEGFGYSAVEAAALGCHVIATSGHATEELLGGAVTLVPPRDARALASALLGPIRPIRPIRPISPMSPIGTLGPIGPIRPIGPTSPISFTAAAHAAGVLAVYDRLLR